LLKIWKKGSNKMGGLGSERKTKKKLTTDLLELNIGDLKRQNFLSLRNIILTWERMDGQIVGTIGLRAEKYQIKLNYVFTEGSSKVPVELAVPIDWVPCHYGSSQPIFRCPNCDRRCKILYGGPIFLCRICHGLAYPVENKPPLFRQMQKIRKIRKKIGAPVDLSKRASCKKPKGMHLAKFLQLFFEEDRARNNFLRTLDKHLDKMLESSRQPIIYKD
jgi:hypothetical protein